jgi:hypothetical protein
MKLTTKLQQIFKRPYFWVTILFYFTVILGLKVLLDIALLNIFTLALIPLTATGIYLIWNLFYNENISDEMFDTRIERLYFSSVTRKDRSQLRKFMKLREEIQKLLEKGHLNPSKSMLLTELKQFDVNELIEKYATNCVKIKFISTFLKKKEKGNSRIGDTIKKLVKASERYAGLNEEIQVTIEAIEAQTVLLLADDVSSTYTSKESIEDILKKIELLDRSNKEINEFYGTIHQGVENGEN